MFGRNPSYNKHIKNAIIAFGRVFSNIYIDRVHETDPTKNQLIEVPLSYAPKEKWLVRIEQDPTLENHVHTVLPRMSFEILNFTYDSTRKLNRMNRVTNTNTITPKALPHGPGITPDYIASTRKETFTPVPYNLDVSLYILTKTQEDNLQILEQILPVFTPEYTVKTTSVADLQLDNDLPIVLNSVNTQDDYDGDFQTRRFVTTTLSFTLKLNVYANTSTKGIVGKTNVGFIPMYDFAGNIELTGLQSITWVAGQSVTIGTNVKANGKYYTVASFTTTGVTSAPLGMTAPTHTVGTALNGSCNLTLIGNESDAEYVMKTVKTGIYGGTITDTWLSDF